MDIENMTVKQAREEMSNCLNRYKELCALFNKEDSISESNNDLKHPMRCDFVDIDPEIQAVIDEHLHEIM